MLEKYQKAFDDFLLEVKALNLRWEEQPEGIRTPSVCNVNNSVSEASCPILALGNKRLPVSAMTKELDYCEEEVEPQTYHVENEDFSLVAEKLQDVGVDLPYLLAQLIVDLADTPTAKFELDKSEYAVANIAELNLYDNTSYNDRQAWTKSHRAELIAERAECRRRFEEACGLNTR